MSNPFVQYESEWEILQRKFGNRPERDVDKEVIAKVVDEAVAQHDPHARKTNAELARDVDEAHDAGGRDDDAAYLENYRRERLARLKAAIKENIFGTVMSVTRATWSQQITETSKDHPVVVLLYNPGDRGSDLLRRCIANLAGNYPATKFCEGTANSLVDNYPVARLPTLILYREGEMLAEQFTGLSKFGGAAAFDPAKVEWLLHLQGMISSDIENPFDEDGQRNRKQPAQGEADDDDW